MTRISVRLFFPVAAAVLLASSACSQGDPQPPVATVTFSANKTRVPLGSPVELTYRFNGRDFRLTDVAGEVLKDILA